MPWKQPDKTLTNVLPCWYICWLVYWTNGHNTEGLSAMKQIKIEHRASLLTSFNSLEKADFDRQYQIINRWLAKRIKFLRMTTDQKTVRDSSNESAFESIWFSLSKSDAWVDPFRLVGNGSINGSTDTPMDGLMDWLTGQQTEKNLLYSCQSVTKKEKQFTISKEV